MAMLLAVGIVPGMHVPSRVTADELGVVITTRHTDDVSNAPVRTDVIYLTPMRRRWEMSWRWPASPTRRADQEAEHTSITITQCDARRTLALNPAARTYGSTPIRDPEEIRRELMRIGRRIAEPASGPEVVMTIDAADSGERRTLGRYTLRHVITTTTTEPGHGAGVPPRTEVRDGWYLDGPMLPCDGPRGELNAFFTADQAPPRLTIKRRRTARLGYPVEETYRMTESGMTSSTRISLIEFSERPLDPALFELPMDYRPALPGLHGGFDLSKADTWWNRAGLYWDEAQALYWQTMRWWASRLR